MPQESFIEHRWAPALATCILSATVALAGCSSTDPSASHGGPSPRTGLASGTESQFVAAAAAEVTAHSKPIMTYPSVPAVSGVASLKGKNVWFIPLASSLPVIAATGSAMQTALTAAGLSMHTCDGELLSTQIASCMSQAIAQHADAVVTGYIDYAQVPSSFDNLVAHHIKVLVAGEAPSGGKTSSALLAFQDATQSIDAQTKLEMETIIADSHGSAKIIFAGNTDSSLTKGGTAAAKAFTAQQCPGCSFTEVDYNAAEGIKLSSLISTALITHPDTTYVVNEVDSGAPATLQGIRSAGFTEKVKLVTADGNLDALQRIAANQQFTDVGSSPVYTGWAFADGTIRLLAGQSVPPQPFVLRVFTTQNVQGLTLTPAAYATNAWYGSNSYRDTFLNAWADR